MKNIQIIRDQNTNSQLKLIEQSRQEIVMRDLDPQAVLIENMAIGVNYIDIYHKTGLYPLPPEQILGMESAGFVTAVGSEVSKIKTGDRIAAVGPVGAYANFRQVSASDAIPLPDNLSFDQAAALMLKGMTVAYLVNHCAKLQSGMTILWHAVSGGVGSIACQWLAQTGVTLLGTASSEEKRQRALSLGAASVFDYRDPDLVNHVLDATSGRGVDVVFDGVGQETFALSLACLARRGLFVTFGNASGSVQPVAPLEMPRSIYLTRPSLFDYISTTDELLSLAGELFTKFRSGLQADIHRKYRLEDIASAHQDLQSRATSGSIILDPQ